MCSSVWSYEHLATFCVYNVYEALDQQQQQQQNMIGLELSTKLHEIL